MNPKLTDGDIELLSRYSDGEMAPMEARGFESRLDSEAELRRGLVRIEELSHRIRDALDARATIPQSLETLLASTREEHSSLKSNSGTVLPFPTTKATSGRDRVASHWPAALAASIALAVTVGVVIDRQKAETRLPGNDRLVDAALDSLPSGRGWSSLADGREVQPVLTFPHLDGNWCREYLLRGADNNWRAVACHDGDRWVTQAAGLEAFMEAGNAYQPAGASDAAPVAVFISQHAADIALDARAEAELLDSWAPRG